MITKGEHYTSKEMVTIFWEGKEMIGMLHQNGEIKMFILRKALKTEVDELLDVKMPQDTPIKRTGTEIEI